MLNELMINTGDFITRYVKSTTIYKSLLIMITLSWLLYPLFGLLPVCISLSCGVIVWLVTENLYTVRLEEELDKEEH